MRGTIKCGCLYAGPFMHWPFYSPKHHFNLFVEPIFNFFVHMQFLFVLYFFCMEYNIVGQYFYFLLIFFILVSLFWKSLLFIAFRDDGVQFVSPDFLLLHRIML